VFRSSKDERTAPGYVNLFVCDTIHMTDPDRWKFLQHNWETLKVGLCSLSDFEPDFFLTELDWCPIAEAEEFQKEGEMKAKKIYKN
jgi:hypothetical protein